MESVRSSAAVSRNGNSTIKLGVVFLTGIGHAYEQQALCIRYSFSVKQGQQPRPRCPQSAFFPLCLDNNTVLFARTPSWPRAVLCGSNKQVHSVLHSCKSWSMDEIRKGRHVVSMLHAHLVFVTKRRGKVFSVAHLRRLEEIFRSVCADFEVALQEFNGEPEHVHLLVT
jgi:Transposase IS200 like